jgi:hypothetical protein
MTGSNQLWVPATASQEEAICLVLNEAPDGWTASPLSNELRAAEIEVLAFKAGEANH